NYIDHQVFAKLKMLSIQPSELCTDQEFIRRAYLDVCGILPTAEETRVFLASTEKGKRARLIDRLLERPEYADFWTLKWCDVIRMQCAKCHNHPFEKWTQDDYFSMAAFFARVKHKKDPTEPGATPPNAGAELVYLDRAGEVVQPRSGKTMPPKFMGGPVAQVLP